MNETLIVAALLSLHAVGLAYSATTHSPTSLEPAFLAAGVSHWQLGRFELYRVNPPLVRLLAALPVLAAGCETDWHQFHDGPGARPEFAIGSDFVHANGPRALYLLQLARWSCIPFSLIGAWFAFRWASELYGRRAGWVTLVLWCFDPNLLAHAEWITPDIACTGLGVAAGYSFWLWLRQGGWLRALITGAALGLVQLSKMSWLMLFGLWPLIWLVYSRMSNERRARSHELSPLAAADRDRLRGQWFRSTSLWCLSRDGRDAMQLTTLLLVAGYIINLGYLFDGTFDRLNSYAFVSRLLSGRDGGVGNRWSESVLGKLPVPFPRQYVLGFDSQKKDFEDYQRSSFLYGEWKQGGWWYYYLFGLLVKVPTGVLLLAVGVFARRIFLRGIRYPVLDELVVLVPAAALFLLASSQTEINRHLRYVYPAWGLALVILGQAACHMQRSNQRVRVVGVTCLLSVVSGTLLVFPHQLAYFNELCGGPTQGAKLLAGSSFDWGQDFLFLREWLRKHRVSDGVYLGQTAYRLQAIGIPCRTIDEPFLGSPEWQLIGGAAFVIPVQEREPDSTSVPGGMPHEPGALHVPAGHQLESVGDVGYTMRCMRIVPVERSTPAGAAGDGSADDINANP